MNATPGQRIRELESGRSIVLHKVPGGGSLEARRLPSGLVQFYWRHTEEKRTERVPIGLYDSSAPPKALKPTARGFSVAAALEHARELAKLNRDTPGGLRADRERRTKAEEAEAAQREANSRYTLQALCNNYTDWLKKQEKSSHADAANIFKNHLFDAFPDVAATRAAHVDKRQIVTVVRKLAEAGKTTTARKLRSYLRAAFSCAVKADSDATLPSSFIVYNVTTNPVEATAAIRTNSDKNPLTTAELRKYWRALAGVEDVIGAALRLHLLTGGQRPAQLVRVRDQEVTRFSLQMLDLKGKRHQARTHLLPITPQIQGELDRLPATGFKLSTDGGRTPMHPTSLSSWAADAAVAAGIAGFQLKRVRSGIETTLAQAGVAIHIRGQLQSHGIGGVQERHYDAHHYLPEKRAALELLYETIAGEFKNRSPRAKVRQMRGSGR